MQTTIRVGEPRELLAFIPFQLGFEPHESAVVVSLRASGRVGLVARVDLEDLTDPEGGPQLARSLVTYLVEDGARSAVLVLYSTRDLRAARGALLAQAARAHLGRAAEPFLTGVACWAVGPEGYYDPACEDLACCPPGGRPRVELESTAVSAQMVLEGSQVLPSRTDLGRMPVATDARRRSARRAAARWTARLAEASDSATAQRWREQGLALWRQEVGRAGADVPTEAAATVLGRLQAALDDVLVRDGVLLGLVPGADRVADRVVAGGGGDEVGQVLRVIIDPEVGLAPDQDRTGAARAVLEAVVAHAPRRSQAPASTLLAVLAWWNGDGARASVLCERALEADEDHRLALLVHEALLQGMPPGWLRAAQREGG